jgi:hypothetical protein
MDEFRPCRNLAVDVRVASAWKHGASRHYVESGQLASIFRWLAAAHPE